MILFMILFIYDADGALAEPLRLTTLVNLLYKSYPYNLQV